MPDAGSARTDPDLLSAALDDPGSLVLTSSRRLARALASAYNLEKVAEGRKGWPTPAVFFWRDWLNGLFREASGPKAPVPVSPAGSRILWERFLRRQVDENVVGIGGLSRQAFATWRVVGEWKLPPEAITRAARSRDEQAFATAMRDYLRALQANHWIDEVGIARFGVEYIAHREFEAPARAFLVGFDRLSPQLRDLFSALADRCTRVERLSAPCTGSERHRHAYVDEEAELRAAGAWARDALTDNPDATIAIVVSELEQDAGRVARLIREGFAPGWQYGGEEHRLSVEVSYGRPLSDYPAIEVALTCLRWLTQGLASVDVSLLLRTPCLAGGDAGARAALERQLRRLPDRYWSAEALADALDARERPSPVDEWIDNARKIAAFRAVPGDRRPPSSWAEAIDSLLASIGWPGEGVLSSEAFQLVNRWRELLNELAALDAVLGQVSLQVAVGRLSILAQETIYQPERTAGAIRVLGPLEAAGMQFDALWVARADADRWPAAGRPSSLVARSLQQQYGLPDASPADTLAYARRVLARLAESAPEVRFSWSSTDLDAVRLPSPLLAELGGTISDGRADPGWFANQLVSQAGVHAVAEDPVPPVRDGESIGGGAATVQLQRTEPFSAFAAGRLGVRELDPFVPGLNPGLRGSLLHAALEHLFSDRPSQSALAAWPQEERARRIGSAVASSLVRIERRADGVLRRLLALERERMTLLLGDVLEHELGREPFSIEKVEERITFSHAGVGLDLRADRIDLLQDGSLLIIDYKTGRVRSLMDRDGELADLQLVVYAAATGGRIGALSLFFVNRREIVHRGAGTALVRKPMEADEWRKLLSRWKAEVFSLMEAIARGDVRVNLRGDAERRWQLNVLCRAAETKRDA